jgi:hypothetical protein
MAFWKDFSPNSAAKWPISLYQQLTGKDASWMLAVVLLHFFLLNTAFSEKYGLDKVIEEDYKSTLAIQESTLCRPGKSGQAPSGNEVKSGGEVDITT